MQTFSLFPALLDYQMLGVFMIRATLGLIFIYFAYEKIFIEQRERIEFFEKLHLRPTKIFFWVVALTELVAGIGLVIGLYTQAVALVTGALMTIATFIKRLNPSALPKNTIEFYIILAVASFALLFLGAGAFAIDLPL